MELPRDYLIQPVAMLRNAGREPAGLPVVIKSEQRSQSRRNAGRNRPEYAGQRVKNVENGVTTYYIGQHFEANVVAGKADNTSYYLVGGERVGKKDSTGTYFYHPDHLGGINAVTDINGVVVSKTSYLPFGEIRQGGQDKYSYTGKEMDKATNLYYFNARYNNPQSRHFTQADTADSDLSDPQDLNRYAYVGNNPLSYVDPDGHKKNHHSKAEQKKLAKQRAAANALKKADKEAKAKQRAAAEYAKHHPASTPSSGNVRTAYSLAASGGQVGTGNSTADSENSNKGKVLGDSIEADKYCPANSGDAYKSITYWEKFKNDNNYDSLPAIEKAKAFLDYVYLNPPKEIGALVNMTDHLFTHDSLSGGEYLQDSIWNGQ